MKAENISKLSDYNKIVQQVSNGNPIQLKKNGKECLILLTNDDYRALIESNELFRKAQAFDRLMSELDKGVQSYKINGGNSEQDVMRFLGLENE